MAEASMTEQMCEKLKNEIWKSGLEAINDLLGCKHNPEEDSYTTETRIEETLDQMPEDIALKFYKKYCK